MVVTEASRRTGAGWQITEDRCRRPQEVTADRQHQGDNQQAVRGDQRHADATRARTEAAASRHHKREREQQDAQEVDGASPGGRRRIG